MKTTYNNGLYSVVKLNGEKLRNIVGTYNTGVWGVYNDRDELVVTLGMRKTAVNVANQLADQRFNGE